MMLWLGHPRFANVLLFDISMRSPAPSVPVPGESELPAISRVSRLHATGGRKYRRGRGRAWTLGSDGPPVWSPLLRTFRKLISIVLILDHNISIYFLCLTDFYSSSIVQWFYMVLGASSWSLVVKNSDPSARCRFCAAGIQIKIL